MASSEQSARTGAAFASKSGRKVNLIEVLQAILALMGAIFLVLGLKFGSFERGGAFVDLTLHETGRFFVNLYEDGKEMVFSTTGGAIKKAGDATRKTGRDIEKMGH